MRAKQPPQQIKDAKSQKIKPQNAWKGLFPRILAVFHCINFSVAMFIGTVKLIQFNDAPSHKQLEIGISSYINTHLLRQ